MLRIRSTDGSIGTTQPWRFFFLEGRGEIGWEYAGIATERSDGGNDCSLPYLLPFSIELTDGACGSEFIELIIIGSGSSADDYG